MARRIRVGDYLLELTNQDKLIFPEDDLIKRDVINFYRRMAPHMLPHIENRPLVLHRFMQGINHEGFLQKEALEYFPSWIRRVPITGRDGQTTNYVVADSQASLVYLSNQSTVDFHAWLSTTHNLENPDRMLFDLDPAQGVPFYRVRSTAKKIKKLLEELGLPTFVMTTGSRGLHVVVPLKPVHTYDIVRTFASDVARYIARRHSDKVTVELQKEMRGKRVYIDVLRNAFGAATVAPYALRAIKGAPVATPITWVELFEDGIHSQSYTYYNIFRRLGRKEDPWKDMHLHAVTLHDAIQKLPTK